MIELTEEQARALLEQIAPAKVLNPLTQETFLLIRKDVYDSVCGFLRPLGRNWDNPADDDLIRRDQSTEGRLWRSSGNTRTCPGASSGQPSWSRATSSTA
jgi:hypothetical protein